MYAILYRVMETSETRIHLLMGLRMMLTEDDAAKELRAFKRRHPDMHYYGIAMVTPLSE